MDQQSGDTDKRNWRERLGIGKNAGSADLPKLSDEFKNGEEGAASGAPTPRAAVHTPIKAAPMAPRAPRAAVPAPAARPAAAPAPRSQPVEPDVLASKLRDQREAAERLAQQRIQAAKARAEAANQQLSPGAQPAAASGVKPKFSFADEANREAASQQQRPAATWQAPAAPRPANPATVPPQQARPQFTPQIQPPRPQLGGAAPLPPPSYQPPYGQPQQPAYNGQGYQPQPPYNPSYANPYGQQPPAYRPIDPATGYAPPPGYNPPNRGLAPQPGSPRLQPPSRGPAAGYPPPASPQQPQLQIGPALDPDADSDDIFETAPTRATAGARRATASDYQQAYQDELDYDDQPQRTGSFGMILGLLLLGLLVAFAVVFGYTNYIKPRMASNGGSSVPVVTAPAQPAKATPDAAPAQGDNASKKQIYDRIEGDHEVPGGPLKQSEQAPAAQQNVDPNAQGGNAAQPVPLPPPPGGNNGQQGSLSPDNNTNIASANPAVEPSSAANSSAGSSVSPQQTVNVTPTSAAPDAKAADATAPAPTAGATAATPDALIPAPGDKSAAAAANSGLPATPSKTADAKPAITDTDADATKAKKPAAAAKTAAAASSAAATAADKTKQANLGSSPVVLVPPSKTVSAASAGTPIVSNAAKPATSAAATSNTVGGGLYGNTVAGGTQLASATPTPKIVAAPAPTPVAPSTTGTGAYVVQLASFSSRDEASAEYARLSAKHGPIVSRYAPIITQSSVAGSTRYNLNLGTMASNDAANSVCSSLIAAGERDCAVRRQ